MERLKGSVREDQEEHPEHSRITEATALLVFPLRLSHSTRGRDQLLISALVLFRPHLTRQIKTERLADVLADYGGR